MKKGFSIVEVLMALTLTAAVMSLSIPAFNVVRNKQVEKKYQTAIYSTNIAVQHILKIYSKLGYVETAPEDPPNSERLTLANLDQFDLQNRTDEDWEALNIDVTERFNIAPLTAGTQNFCTQFASSMNTIPIDNNGVTVDFLCDNANNGPDDLNVISSSGIQFYGLNQPFPGGTIDGITVGVILEGRSDEEYQILIESNGQITPIGEGQDLTKVSYRIRVHDLDKETVIANLVSFKGMTEEYATSVVNPPFNPVGTIVPFSELEEDRLNLHTGLTSGDSIVFFPTFYKPKLVDFAF